ncbi:hypothetical protein AALP_AAs51459U000100, partial [Arabis alpina]
IELSEYDIEYKGRTCNKSQVFADFLIELPKDQSAKEDQPGIWELHVDGSSSKNGSGVGIRLASPTGEILEQSFRLGFRASNNEAEYEAIIAGMRLAKGLNIEHVHAFCDSQLVSNQFSGEYATKDDRMEAYQKIVKDLALTFKEFTLTRIPRAENVDADALANFASASAPPKDPTLKRTAKQAEATTEIRGKDVEMTDAEANTEPAPLTTPASDADATGPKVIGADVAEAEDHEDLRQLEESPTQNLPLDPIDKDMTVPMDTDEEPEYGCDKPWMDQIRAYIVGGKLPNSKWVARKVQKQAARYVLFDDNIYRRGFSGPLLTCVEGQEARQVMEEVHSRSCGNHSGGTALAIKIKRHGHFWLTIVNDCIKFSAKCERCQRHAPKIHQPTEKLSSVTSPYPFM